MNNDAYIKSPSEITYRLSLQTLEINMKKNKKDSFDFETIPEIIGIGIKTVERELTLLAAKSESQGLTDSESKLLISYITTLKDVKKDYLAEVASIQKELKSLTTEELMALSIPEKKMAS